MNKDDYTFCTYRGHHHNARARRLDEACWRADGPAMRVDEGQGRLDASDERRARRQGSYAIVGAHLPIAAGAAWSAQYRGTKQVAVAFFGDGATNIGAFTRRSISPRYGSCQVIFCCENNM